MANLELRLDGFESHLLDSAIVRLGYLYPDLTFSLQENQIQIQGQIENCTELLKEIRYIIYREKIYEETLPIRKKLYENL